ncbi:LysR family transcriptional regulator [Staphylococcus sp. HKU1]|uniref:glutamate biosynthesis transcriptional regulator GltC n=1 Tax=unclassified Staphylococcus TaxID=91994 RepID=UPI00203F4115|nr:LysR family transcriptional regulator [Staphylococcus sp. Marseille-Q6910]
MEIKQLKYFIEVAKKEHLSDAALELDVAQSAVSRQISQLERELQVTLFKRSGRNIYLTDEGKQLLTHATQMLDQIDTTVRLFREQSQANHYKIRIGYIDSYISQVLTLLIQTFEHASTSIVEPMHMNEDEIIDALMTDKIDIAFTHLDNEIKNLPGLDIRPLFEAYYHIYVPKADPLTMATNPPLVQLADQTIYALYPLPHSIKQTLARIVKSPIHTITSPQLATYLLNQQRGYIITASYHSLNKNEGDWTEISLAHTELKQTVCSVVRKDNKKQDIQLMQSTIKQLMNQEKSFH